jgi:CBS domain-containing protein
MPGSNIRGARHTGARPFVREGSTPMQVRDLMTADVRTVSPNMRLTDLERLLIRERLSGAPVVKDGRLVGVVSRSDVVRQLVVERTSAEYVADARSSGLASWHHLPDGEMTARISDAVGEHLEHVQVEDIMVTDVITVAPDADLRDAARLMIDHHVHRVLVVEDSRVRGILSTTDLVRLVAHEAPSEL